jgi:hypothetical protein
MPYCYKLFIFAIRLCILKDTVFVLGVELFTGDT